MKKIINLRGVNGSGKTTVVRSFIKHRNLHEEQLTISSLDKPITIVCDDEKTIIILGKYSGRTCGGCDGQLFAKQIIEAILQIIKKFSPEVIIYEGITLSTTSTFTFNVAKFARERGYDFCMIYLFREFNTCVNAVLARNVGKSFNKKTMLDKHNCIVRSFYRLKAMGIYGVQKQPDDYNIDELYKIIEEEI